MNDINAVDTRTAAYGALVLRLSLGIMFISHALLKVLVFTIPGTVGYFESLGLPGFFAHLTIAAEIGGGALLILGVKTRLVAAALLPVLLGALWAHSGNGWVFSAPNGGWEYPLFLAVAAFVQILIGDGVYALRPGLVHAGGKTAPAE
ncbi:MAG: DoxX family protein [Alphaproteobacteria bacterium]